MSIAISLETQNYAMACYKAFIEDLEKDVRNDSHPLLPSYEGHFQSIRFNLEKLSKRPISQAKEDVTNLITSLNRLENTLLTGCLNGLTHSLIVFTRKIVNGNASSLRRDYNVINEDMKIYRIEIQRLSFKLPKLKTEVINKSFTDLVNIINTKIRPYKLTVNDEPQQAYHPRQKRITFSQKSQSLSIALLGSQIDDLLHDTERDPDCRHLTYAKRIDSIFMSICEKAVHVSEGCQKQICALKLRINQVNANLMSRDVSQSAVLAIFADEIGHAVLMRCSLPFPWPSRPKPDPGAVIRPSVQKMPLLWDRYAKHSKFEWAHSFSDFVGKRG